MTNRRVAFFGATGGCANSCLAFTLREGYGATALVRSPDKLRAQLSKRDISTAVCDKQLTIVEGHVRDTDAVRKVLEGIDIVVSGIGGVPSPQLDPFKPLSMTDPTITADATTSILRGLRNSSTQPLVIVISANGVLDNAPRDYPLLLSPLYRWMLRGVFDDKRNMEALLEEQPPKGGYVVVRPSVLSDGPSKGMASIRQGWTEEPVQGYGIARDDVGLWIFEKLVRSLDEQDKFKNRGVQITY